MANGQLVNQEVWVPGSRPGDSVNDGTGQASGAAVPWWIWLVVAVVGYQMVKK